MGGLHETSTDSADVWLLNEDGYSSFHDVDTPADVDAAFRSQRRIAVAYFVVFVVVVAGVAAVTVASDWATSGRVLGGFSPSFLAAAVGLYVLFVALGIAAAGLANGVDDRMMGADSLPPPRRSRTPGEWARARGGRGSDR